jgi:hypothetical protein
MGWAAAAFSILKAALPILKDWAKGNGTDTAPAVRRIEHDVDRLTEQHDLVVKYQGDLVADVAEIAAAVARIEAKLAEE